MEEHKKKAAMKVYWNYHTDRYHKSEACAGNNDRVIETELGGCRYGPQLACERCNTHKL